MGEQLRVRPCWLMAQREFSFCEGCVRSSVAPCWSELPSEGCSPSPLPQGPCVSIVPCAAKHYLRASVQGAAALHGSAFIWEGSARGSRAEQPPARPKGRAHALLPNPSLSTGEFLLVSGRDRACASSWGAVDLCKQRLPFSGAFSGCVEGKCSSPRSCLQQLKAFQVSISLPPQS